MSVMGTFGSFTTARLAIYAAQKSLSITGNNIANINTDGYTRENVDQVALHTGGADRYQYEYAADVGNGVLCTGVAQTRDSYLDIRYRTQMASVGTLDTKLSGLNDLAEILDEVGDGENAGDGIVEAQLNDLFETLENLNVNAGHDEYDSQVRSSASSLCILLNSYAKKLAELEDNTKSQLYQSVDSVNEVISNIRDLNSQIRKSEIHGDDALELRDERNVLIDELSEYMKIDVTYEMEDLGGGEQVEKLVIRLGGANEDTKSKSDTALLVDGIYCTQLSLGDEAKADQAEAVAKGKGYTIGNDGVYDASMYNIVLSELTDAKGRAWKDTSTATEGEFEEAYKAYAAANNIPVTADANGNVTVPAGDVPFPVDNGDGTVTEYSISQETVQPDPNDPAAIAAGATTVVTYTKTTKSQAYMLNDNDLAGSLQSYRELLTESGEFSSATMRAYDSNASTKRGIPYYQQALDVLANQIATKFNQFNQNYETDINGNYVDANGDPITYQIAGANGQKEDVTLNINMTADEMEAALKYFTDDPRVLVGNTTNEDAGILFSNGGTVDDTTGITAANISISNSWANGSVRIANSFNETVTGGGIPSTASDNIDRYVALFTQEQSFYTNQIYEAVDEDNDIPLFKGTFQEMLTNISATLGNDIRSTSVLLDTANSAATALDTSRDSVSGVDLNDEAMNLMQYQKSYQAACRLMTVLDEVLDKLVNGTAV